jgi:hypothetical protein
MNNSSFHFKTCLLYFLIATGLTLLFWLPLWFGGGFVGGDLYSYFFPQKILYAESLQQLEIPFWNNRTGWGYPLIGESQTGVFYPFNLLLYQIFSPNNAYHFNQIIHYIIAFITTILFARRTGISKSSSILAALIFVYGWFPARACVEWGIVTGAWLPVTLFCLESFLQSKLWRYLVLLSAAICLQLLAGHFELAFLTQLTLVGYLLLRLFLKSTPASSSSKESNSKKNNQKNKQKKIKANVDSLDFISASTNRNKLKLIAITFLFIFLGGMLASVQLLPTYELKKRSQRDSINKNHELEFGSIPIWYMEQIVRPAKWYSLLVNRNKEFQKHPPVNQARTNEVEAHLYFGLIPIGFVFWSIWYSFKSKDSRSIIWMIIGLLFGLYTTGILLMVTKYLPGFQYFQGPGRYGIVTTLAVAMVAGLALDRFLDQKFTKPKSIMLLIVLLYSFYSCWSLSSDTDFLHSKFGGTHKYLFGSLTLNSSFWLFISFAGFLGMLAGLFFLSNQTDQSKQKGKMLVIAAIVLATFSEFWIISRNITFVTMVQDPPITHLSESPVKKILAESDQPVRMWSPGANFPNVLGCSSIPVYLTFGPSVYFDEKWNMPHSENGIKEDPAQGQIHWLKNNGITHLLSYEPLNEKNWQMKLLWKGFDPVLNPAWARFREPIYLYQIENALGRAWLVDPTESNRVLKNSNSKITKYHANEVQIDVNTPKLSRLILADLKFPGWNVYVDGKQIEQKSEDSVKDTIFREVNLNPGKHQVVWKYQSESIYWGTVLSLIAFFILTLIAHVSFWHPTRLEKVVKLNNS